MASETDISGGSYYGLRGLILSGERRARYSPKWAQLLQFSVFGFGRMRMGMSASASFHSVKKS